MSDKAVKVLVTDDDPFVRDMIAMILGSNGYEVETATDGRDAIEKQKADPEIGLVISDMNMPGMTGLELIKHWRGAGLDVPVIILTGSCEISVAIDAMNSGANDYLLKDENIQDTVALSVSKVLEKHHLKKQNAQLMADIAQKNERLEKEKALAQKVQKNILPGNLKFEGLDVESFYKPSDKIGGDFFDAWETGDGVHFLIGDVSGHSTSSALIMAVSKGMLKSLGYSMRRPVEILQTANRMLCDIVGESGMFLSLVYGVFRRGSESVDLVSAGHNPVFLVENGSVSAIESTGSVMGWDPDDSWETVSKPFRPGARLVLYTDGLTEAKNGSGEEFGEKRLAELLERCEAGPAIMDGILSELGAFSGNELNDDLTIFVLKRD